MSWVLDLICVKIIFLRPFVPIEEEEEDIAYLSWVSSPSIPGYDSKNPIQPPLLALSYALSKEEIFLGPRTQKLSKGKERLLLSFSSRKSQKSTVCGCVSVLFCINMFKRMLILCFKVLRTMVLQLENRCFICLKPLFESSQVARELSGLSNQMLFSMCKKRKTLRHYCQIHRKHFRGKPYYVDLLDLLVRPRKMIYTSRAIT